MKPPFPFLIAFCGILPLVPSIAAGSPPPALKTAAADPASAKPEPAGIDWNTAEGKAFHAVWEKEGHRFTPAVKAAYLALAKAETLRELTATGRHLPADFLAWVDGDPVVAATVYGARHNPADVLTVLRSLELDLGTEEVRHKHTQLALAMAVVHSVGDSSPEEGKGRKGNRKSAPSEGLGVSLAPRPLLKLQVPGNPLEPVNTHPTDRPLDVNDHIVNFFEGRTVEVEAKAGKKAKGAAPVPETKTLPMAACDVIADPRLQEEFNAYMKAHGQDVRIDCGDHVVSRNSKAAVKGPQGKGVLEAFRLFKSAYEAKGLLPARRDREPTLAETFAWLVRNDGTPLPDGVKRKWDRWPIFPLNAPWPVLTYLAQWRQPLRESEDLFARYRDKGEFHGYGEYIGPIAQQFDFQSARRLSPYPFAYGTFQMMLKDGGVCGTMANMQTRSELALGIPSTTAGQPGHCALVSMRYSPVDKTYALVGSQFVTGGPEKTTPHLPWVFASDTGRRPMIYPMTTAFAVNHGVQSFLDSSIAWKLCRQLPEADRRTHGLTLLQSALALNPYNFLLVDSARELITTPEALLTFSDGFDKLLAAENQPGCPNGGLYRETVHEQLGKRLADLPVPSDKAILSRLADLTEKGENGEAWQKFQTALHGVEAVRSRLLDQLKSGVAGGRTAAGTMILANRIQAVVRASPKSSAKAAWISALQAAISGNETFTTGRRKKVVTDPSAAVILKAAGKRAQAAAREAARAKAEVEDASRDLSKEPEGDRRNE